MIFFFLSRRTQAPSPHQNLPLSATPSSSFSPQPRPDLILPAHNLSATIPTFLLLFSQLREVAPPHLTFPSLSYPSPQTAGSSLFFPCFPLTTPCLDLIRISLSRPRPPFPSPFHFISPISAAPFQSLSWASSSRLKEHGESGPYFPLNSRPLLASSPTKEEKRVGDLSVPAGF